MKKQSALVLIGLLILIAGMAISQLILVDRRRPTEDLPPEDPIQAFTWFDTLGFPDVKGRPFVRVATGRCYWIGNDGPPRTFYIRGFLLEDRGDTFSVLTLSLETKSFRKSPAKTAAHEQVGYEVLDLAKEALLYSRALTEPSESTTRDSSASEMFGEVSLHPVTEVFVLAWACWRNGLDSLAAELSAHAARIPKGHAENSDEPFGPTLKQVVADKLADTEMGRAILAAGDPAITRARLRERFELLVKHYPDSKHLDQAREIISLLRQMVQEDAEHAEKRRTGKPFEELSKQEQIAELVFQLRDQNGYRRWRPGPYDCFTTRSGKEDTAAHRLVQRGYDAVPQLIDALGDRRLTRSVVSSHHVWRVGDCAEVILSRIAGRTFSQGSITKDGEGAKVEAEIKEWWAELQKKGEKRLLLDAVKRGDHNSYYQADRLLERYPDAALPAIITGVNAAKDRWTRDALIAVAARVKGDAPIPLLLAEVKRRPHSKGRLTAARGLHERGRPEGVAAMIEEWNDQQPSRRPWDSPMLEESVAEFLAGCGRVEAINALAKDLDNRPVDLRLAVVKAFAESHTVLDLSTGGGQLPPAVAATRDSPEALRVAIEQLLIAALDDAEERLCDFAGHVLNQRAPEKYRFDRSAPLVQRKRSIVELKNVWRKAQGLPPLPLPAPRAVPPVSDKKLQPLLDDLLRGPHADRRNVERQIEQLGLGALPGTLSRLAKAGRKDDPDRAVLERLARRLACIVAEVVVADRSLRPDTALAAQLEAMTGEPFDPLAFTRIIVSLVRKLPTGAHGFRVAADRTGDGTGITLKVDLLDEARAGGVRRMGWIPPGATTGKGKVRALHCDGRVKVGRTSFQEGTGFWTPDSWIDKGSVELRGALAAACSAAVDQPIEVRFQLAAEVEK